MQKNFRINENQLFYLANKSRSEGVVFGHLWKKTSDNLRWQQKYFSLYQNYLFYYETESNPRPSGVMLLEGCYCERVIPTTKNPERQYLFVISFRNDSRQYELSCDNREQCDLWVNTIQAASFNKLLLHKEELDQKYQHLMQILESERSAKYQYMQQCQDQTEQIAKLRTELSLLKKDIQRTKMIHSQTISEFECEELRKIKKVQSFLRGWLCRRRWKSIVAEYIVSPMADQMRKRNRLVFSMVENEQEYVCELSTLVNCFLRPLKMAASSKKPLITHEDVNSIFLNSETVLFLHQIFLKGLKARLDAWPKLVLGDLFDMLLPMLSIYQEYVRNHHYSLQVLTECKQRAEFSSLIQRYEEKAACNGRTLETFLTYPMHQIPRYILTLHELLSCTPHDHVELKSLEFAKEKLEELSNVMHDEVSETENIRKNLSIERTIFEGCDILLDVQQIFIRQGSLMQTVLEKTNKSNRKIGPLSMGVSDKKDGIRQCFLFTNHLIVTYRSGGKLHLAKVGGKIALSDATLVEDDTDEEGGFMNSFTSIFPQKEVLEYDGRYFKLILASKNQPPLHMLFVAPTNQEKEAWITDLGQCIDNIHVSGLLTADNAFEDNSSIRMMQSVRSDPHLFKDDIEIRFSRITNSCRVPQIRYATVEKLFERLTDVRFLSVEFLNTFLMTYRYFTTAVVILDVLRRALLNCAQQQQSQSLTLSSFSDLGIVENFGCKLRRSYHTDHRRNKSSGSITPSSNQSTIFEKQSSGESDEGTTSSDLIYSGRAPFIPPQGSNESDDGVESSSFFNQVSVDSEDSGHHATFSDTIHSAPVVTLQEFNEFEEKRSLSEEHAQSEDNESLKTILDDADTNRIQEKNIIEKLKEAATKMSDTDELLTTERSLSVPTNDLESVCSSNISGSRHSSIDVKRRSMQSNVANISPNKFSPGVVVTSSRKSTRRSSLQAAAAAFAAATAGSNTQTLGRNAPIRLRGYKPLNRDDQRKRSSILTSAKSKRVLNVLRHWATKFPEDFVEGSENCDILVELLEVGCNTNCFSPSELKVASGILKALAYYHETKEELDLWAFVTPTGSASTDSFDTIQVLDIAENLTYLDFKVFASIPYWEFFNTAWMNRDKNEKAPHVILATKRFNDVSNLVATTILRENSEKSRATVIEKWAAVADICRCLNNLNTVLEIVSAFERSAVYRLRKTWDRISRQCRTSIDKLISLVSADCRFKNMRDALHKCDPPCLPYLGFYLTDLTFIEDGTHTSIDDGLINFSKMRMISNVIQEIRLYQQTPFRIQPNQRIINWLLDPNNVWSEDQLYSRSLEIEPKVQQNPQNAMYH